MEQVSFSVDSEATNSLGEPTEETKEILRKTFSYRVLLIESPEVHRFPARQEERQIDPVRLAENIERAERMSKEASQKLKLEEII